MSTPHDETPARRRHYTTPREDAASYRGKRTRFQDGLYHERQRILELQLPLVVLVVSSVDPSPGSMLRPRIFLSYSFANSISCNNLIICYRI